MSDAPQLKVKCVNAHDRCYGGAGGPCPYCEPVITPPAAGAQTDD